MSRTSSSPLSFGSDASQTTRASAAVGPVRLQLPWPSPALVSPPAAADEIRQVRDEAARMLDEVNEHRVGLGLRAVTEIAAITALAEDHAAGLYRSGMLRRMGDCVSNLDTRGYQVVRCDNGVALAGTAAGALSGIEESAGGQEMLATADFDRAGDDAIRPDDDVVRQRDIAFEKRRWVYGCHGKSLHPTGWGKSTGQQVNKSTSESA